MNCRTKEVVGSREFVISRYFKVFFLFGARGTGKSTLLRQMFQFPKTAKSGALSANAFYIDLLEADEEQLFLT